jgi:glucose/arabinose dehydrogenase
MKSFLALACLAAVMLAQAPPISNPATIVPRPAGAQIKVPHGFSVNEYAAGFARPRFMVEGRGGEVLVSDTVSNGSVIALRDGAKKVLISGLDRPYGLALWKEYLYVGEPESLKRYKYDSKALVAGPGEEVVSMAGFSKGHVTRTILFDERASKVYLTVGSSADLVTGDPEMRAAVHRYNADGTGHEVIATGLRNTVGLRFYPGTTQLWATVEERNDAPNVVVADFFTSLKPGGFYGWPYAYLGQNVDPRIQEKDRRPDLVAKSIAPEIILAPHCAVLDLLFYSGTQFPAEYRNGAFLANHGSSQGEQRVGYSVSFVPFKNGKPAGPVRDFATGWMLGADKKEVWGRPVALLQLRDGSVLVSDDGGKVIWRMSYKKG